MYDMDELEIQNKILLDITSRELKEEKDKWHRKYNDALIENAKLSKENEDYKMAIHRLIVERDMAIADFNTLATETSYWDKDDGLINSLQIYKNNKWVWRGVKR